MNYSEHMDQCEKGSFWGGNVPSRHQDESSNCSG